MLRVKLVLLEHFSFSTKMFQKVAQPGGGGGGGGGGEGGALPLWESVGMRRGFAHHFRSFRSFCPPKFDHVYYFIQILLGAVLNFEWRTPTDFDPECPPRPLGAQHQQPQKWLCYRFMALWYRALTLPWTKWTPFHRQYIQMQFCECKVLHFD